MTSPTTTESTRTRSSAPAASSLIIGAFLVPLVFWVGADESFVLPKLVTAVAVGAASAVRLSGGRGRLATAPWHYVDGAVIAWFTFVFLSFLTSIDHEQSWWGEAHQRQGLAASLVYVATYALGRSVITDRRRVRLLLHALAGAATISAGYAVLQRLGLDPLWSEPPGGRVFSTIGQPNSLGAFFAMSLPITVGLAIVSTRRHIVLGLGASMQTLALVLTASRGGYLGVVVGGAILAVFLLGRRGWQWPGAVAVIVAAVMGLGILLTITPGLEASVGPILDRATTDAEWSTGSIRNHLDLWKVAGHVIVDHPVLGTGPDTFPEVFGDYRDDVLSADSATRLRPYRVESPHNIVLAAASGSGIPAALAFVVAVYGAVSIGLRRGRTAPRGTRAMLPIAAATGIIGGFVASLFITADFTTTWVTWILIGALVGSRTPGAVGTDVPT